MTLNTSLRARLAKLNQSRSSLPFNSKLLTVSAVSRARLCLCLTTSPPEKALSVSAIIYNLTVLCKPGKKHCHPNPTRSRVRLCPVHVNPCNYSRICYNTCLYQRLKRAWVRAELRCVHHVLALIHPAGVSWREVWKRRKSSLQAQVSARLQPLPLHSSPPLCLLKSHPASLNVRSHHRAVIPDPTLFAWIQDFFFFFSTNSFHVFLSFFFLNAKLFWAGCRQDALISVRFFPPAVLPNCRRPSSGMSWVRGQGYLGFIQQWVVSYMPWCEVKRSLVWAPRQTVGEHTDITLLVL